jgi:hypothetical protein
VLLRRFENVENVSIFDPNVADHFNDLIFIRGAVADEVRTMRGIDDRIIHIQSVLLPEANRLAISYGGDEVFIDPYASTLARILQNTAGRAATTLMHMPHIWPLHDTT